MTVAELIEALAAFAPDLTVTVDGYEGGVTERIHFVERDVEENANSEGYYGEHEPLYPHESREGRNVKNVLVLSPYGPQDR